MAYCAYSSRHDDRIRHKGGKLSRAHAAANHVLASDPDHCSQSAKNKSHHDGNEHRAHEDTVFSDVEGGFDIAREHAVIVRLLVIRLHGLDLLNTLADIGAHIRYLVLAIAREPAHLAAKEHNGADDEGNAEQHDTRQLGVGDKQKKSPANHH